MNALAEYNSGQVALIKRTVAKDCNDDEFRMFIHLCRATRLDPLRRQCYAFVYNRDKADKRQLTLVTAIAGYRTIADRTGDYRPDETEPEYHLMPWKIDRDKEIADIRRLADLKERRRLMEEVDLTWQVDPLNPDGIERAVSFVWKFSHGSWYRAAGEAWWSEFVPIKEEWAEPEGGGRSQKTGRSVIDPKKTGWTKMRRLMIAKCSESLALRKGWPDDYSNVSVEEETHREESRIDAIEAIRDADEKERLNRIGRLGRTIMIDLGSEIIEPVPVGQFTDRCLAFIEAHKEEPAILDAWQIRNRHALREFHAVEKAEALAIKKRLEDTLEAAQAKIEATVAQEEVVKDEPAEVKPDAADAAAPNPEDTQDQQDQTLETREPANGILEQIAACKTTGELYSWYQRNAKGFGILSEERLGVLRNAYRQHQDILKIKQLKPMTHALQGELL